MFAPSTCFQVDNQHAPCAQKADVKCSCLKCGFNAACHNSCQLSCTGRFSGGNNPLPAAPASASKRLLLLLV